MKTKKLPEKMSEQWTGIDAVQVLIRNQNKLIDFLSEEVEGECKHDFGTANFNGNVFSYCRKCQMIKESPTPQKPSWVSGFIHELDLRESKMYRYYKSVFIDGFGGGYPTENDESLKSFISKTREEAKAEEHQFFLNILAGIDIADEQMGNKGGGTKAIRLALKSRIIKE